MTIWMTDERFNSVALIIIAFIGIIPLVYSRQAKKNSEEAKTNSAEARDAAIEAADQVKVNGGMSDPNPNMNDHVQYQTQMLENLGKQVQTLAGSVAHVDGRLTEHLDHSKIMDKALAEVYFVVKREHPGSLPDETDDT